MASTSPHIAEVGRQDFDQQVLQRSRQVPVLVDFWAAWCGPCQMLMPLLAKLAGEYQGRFFLAKVNSDQEQELARQYGIRSLPTVKLFKDGAVADEFMGVQPEAAIRELLDRHIPRESDAALAAALAARQDGKTEQALEMLDTITQSDSANEKAKIAYADLLFACARYDESEQVLGTLAPASRQEPAIAAMLARVDFARAAKDAPPVAELEHAIAEDTADCQARYRLAAHQVLQGEYEAALQQLLEIVKRDRAFADDAGRKGMLIVFDLLGGKGELVNRYRHLLATALN